MRGGFPQDVRITIVRNITGIRNPEEYEDAPLNCHIEELSVTERFPDNFKTFVKNVICRAIEPSAFVSAHVVELVHAFCLRENAITVSPPHFRISPVRDLLSSRSPA